MENVLNESRDLQIVDRLIMRLASQTSPSLCMLIEQLPLYFRVTAIESNSESHGWVNIAEIFHERASLRVKWISSGKTNIQVNQVVSIRWKGQTESESGSIIISRLVTQNIPPKGLNILETIPLQWLKNRKLVERVIRISRSIPENYMDLINGILWSADRLYEFVTGPSSLNHHHAYVHGNLQHTVEVCELASRVIISQTINKQQLILLCFLHDIGKTVEYARHPVSGRYSMSTRGKLIGHKMTAFEWAVEAKAKYNIQILSDEWMQILHGLCSVQGIADWTGIRNAQTKESLMMAQVDNLSSKQCGQLTR